jgi:pimeloyl-ACP methyl ester carboxylesterase
MKVDTGEETRTRAIDAGGRRLAWRSVGTGPPLLLVNGYAATAEDWDPAFLDALGESFEVLLPDNRGMGESELGDPAGVTVDGMAADLERILGATGLRSAPVVGWSMGGFVAQRMAARDPGRVDALVLISTDPGGPDAARADPAVWRRLTDHSGSPREQATRLLELLFPPVLARDIDREFGDVVAAARSRLAEDALFAQELAMDRWHDEEQPPAEPPPRTLIAAGDQDLVIPPANARVLAARFPDGRIEIFAGGGHAFQAQEPRRLADSITEFVLD